MTVLPDILAPGLNIVFCGTAVSNVSAQREAYYAGPGNMFWPTLFAIGLTPRLLQPEEFREVLSYGLGLTEFVKAVRVAVLVALNSPVVDDTLAVIMAACCPCGWLRVLWASFK